MSRPPMFRRARRHDRARTPRRTTLAAVVFTAAVSTAAVACAGEETTLPELSPLAQEGRDLYQQTGCAGCHGRAADGGVGPNLVGIRDTERELVGGEVVVADTEYLVRAIMEPDAEIVAGYSLRMPPNRLDRDQVDAIIAFLDELEPSS